MLVAYTEKGEKEVKEVDSTAWKAGTAWKEEKKKDSKDVAEKLFAERERLRQQVEEDKEIRAKRSADDAALNRKRGSSAQKGGDSKKARSSGGSQKHDKAKMYINKRVAKAFEQEDANGKIVTQIFYGTIDRLSSQGDEPLLWHILVSFCLTYLFSFFLSLRGTIMYSSAHNTPF